MYQIDAFGTFPGLVHGFSEAAEGNMDFRFGPREEVLGSRRVFLEMLGVPLARCVMMEVQHEEHIMRVGVSHSGCGATTNEDAFLADALMTNEFEVYLVATTADCFPVILYDFRQHAVALMHLGRRNVSARFAGNVVKRMGVEFGSKPEDIVVGIGPGAGKEAYLLPVSVLGRCYDEWSPFLAARERGMVAVDLEGRVTASLQAAGIQSDRIFGRSVDTILDERFFSHYRAVRRGETEGRMMTVVGCQLRGIRIDS